MRVGFRVDASVLIGTGHVKRCLSLAHALHSAGVPSIFVVRELGLPAAAWIRAEGFDVVTLAPPPTLNSATVALSHQGWAGVDNETDAAQTAAVLRQKTPDWLVVDHYSFDARWHRAAKVALGSRIAAIDDLGDRHLEVQLVIDHNYCADHRSKYHGYVARSVPILEGPRYALLGPSYRSAARFEVSANVRSVGIFMGGVDRGGYSLMALEALNAMGFEGQIEVATTTSNPGAKLLRDAVARRPGARLTLDLPDLSFFFARHDLQIGACGGATWERCCVGAPTLAIVVAENQRFVLEPLVDLDVLVAADEILPTAVSLSRGLRRLIDNADLRVRLSRAAQALVDGHGAERAATFLLNL